MHFIRNKNTLTGFLQLARFEADRRHAHTPPRTQRPQVRFQTPSPAISFLSAPFFYYNISYLQNKNEKSVGLPVACLRCVLLVKEI